jgi:hypothetical protein
MDLRDVGIKSVDWFCCIAIWGSCEYGSRFRKNSVIQLVSKCLCARYEVTAMVKFVRKVGTSVPKHTVLRPKIPQTKQTLPYDVQSYGYHNTARSATSDIYLTNSHVI